MIDPAVESLVTLAKATHLVNPSRPPNISTVWRWVGNGVRGTRLEALRIGGVRYTSTEAIARFLVALNSPSAVPTPPNRAAELAGEKLRAMGC